LERILSFQYSNGFAPRSIKEGKIRDDNFSDNCVWIAFTASAILKELGDVSILDRQIPFNDGSSDTLYEHIRRSVDFLYHFRGLHGLIKIWGGDWNDCMNTAGLEGKGVSVWLSLAWLRANKVFAEIARIYGKEADVRLADERSKEMEAIIEKYGWDGEYYLDAYNDRDDKIGSKENEEGRIYLIPQLWAVLSDIGDGRRQQLAMDAVEKYLADPLGIRISDPPYTKYDPNIGVMTTKYPGIHENGGVYLHTIAWKIAADAMLKRADKVEAGIETMLPFRNKVVNGRAEPYMLCNSYFGVQTGYRYGTPGQSWRSASSPWFMMALVRYVYGLQPEMTGLRIDPCLPPSWENVSITKMFRGTQYHIRYENHGPRVKQILVDGKPIDGNILPPIGKKRCAVTVITY
jgi:cellobiose phosphorylase